MSSAYEINATEWRQDLELLAAIDVSTDELVSSFEAVCTKHNVQRINIFKDLATLGQLDAVYKITAALLDTFPDDRDIKVAVLDFYSNIDDFANGTRAAEGLLTTYKNEPLIYYYLAYAYKYAGEREKLIHILKLGSENCARPVDFQASSERSLPEHINAAVLDEIIHQNEPALPAPSDDLCAPSNNSLSVKTHHAQEIGSASAVLSGVLAHTRAGGEYCFQYGPSANKLETDTKWQPVPPDCFSEVRDTTLSTFSSWMCYGYSHEFSAEPCAITSEWPFAIDRNHLDGAGQVTLLYGWRPSTLPPDHSATSARMHALDLRGAEVTFQVRHEDMDTKGGHLVLGVASQIFGGNSSKPDDVDSVSTAWMMTGKPMICANTKNGEWSEINAEISADPQLWSFGSNNRSEQENHARYAYWPLSQTIGEHNGNLIMYQMFADEKELPEGKITLREGRVTYRDWSMLRNGNGAELVVFPGQDKDAALKLTNGQYRNQADGWNRSNDDAASPCKFVWQLPEGSQTKGIVLIQNPRYPVRMAQVYLRNGGPDGRIVHAGLISFTDFEINQPNRSYVPIPDDTSATHLEVNLMQGQNAEGMGLMGVEAFGSFSPKLSASDPVTVCEDINHLTPGSDLHYRLVYRDENSITEGEIQTLKLPNDATPVLYTLNPIEGDHGAWLLHGNPMGLDTKVEVRLDGDVIQDLPLGRETYRRHTLVRVSEAQYAPGKLLEVQARNESGASDTISLIVP